LHLVVPGFSQNPLSLVSSSGQNQQHVCSNLRDFEIRKAINNDVIQNRKIERFSVPK
jgi:hypothetical protein